MAQSGLYKAGTILLLVGAILNAAGAGLMLVFSLVFLVLGTRFDEGEPLGVMGAIYLGFGLLMAVGTVFGFTAHARATRGEAHGAWIHGLVASLLPPLQVVLLLGAIFVLVSPEGEAAQRAHRA